MAVGKRLSKVAREFNVGTSTIVEFLHKKGYDIDTNPNTKINDELYSLLDKEYKSDLRVRKESEELGHHFSGKHKNESVSLADVRSDVSENETSVEKKEKKTEEFVEEKPKADLDFKVVGKIDLNEVAPKKKSVEKKTPEKETPKPKTEEKAPAKAEEAPVVKKEVPKKKEEEKPVVKKEPEHIPTKTEKLGEDMKVVGKISLDKPKVSKPSKPEKKKLEPKVEVPKELEVKEEKTPVPPVEEVTTKKPEARDEIFKPNKTAKLTGPTVVGKINLPKVPVKSSDSKEERKKHRKKRKRIRKDKVDINAKVQPNANGNNKQAGGKSGDVRKKKVVQHRLKKRPVHKEVAEEDVQKQIKDTLARLTKKGKSKTSKYRREKRDAVSQKQIAEIEKQDQEKKVLKVTEFVTANELASMMDVPVNEVISTFMSLGVFVSINQRLDAETLSVVAVAFD